jgi:hypothetical protein
MSEIRIKFIVIYAVAVLSAYLLKKEIYRIANKAIKEEKLSTGLYSLFPIEGKKAIELAKGSILAANIYFWFMVVIFPLGFVILLYHDAI